MATRNEPINQVPGQLLHQLVYEGRKGIFDELERLFKMKDGYKGLTINDSAVVVYHEGMVESEADAIINSHDPAFLKPSKLFILNDGVDVVTVQITLPHTSAETVTPTISGEAMEAETLEAAKFVNIEITAEGLVAGDVITVGVDGHPCDVIRIEVQDAG